MKELLDLNGIVTVLNTPFSEDDAIDVESLRKNVALALEAGVAGFLVPAMASEVDKLSKEERHAIVREVLDEVNGRVPVIGGASAPSRQERIDYARELTEAGCEGVLVSIPFENETQFIKDVEAVAETNPGFLMIQDWDPHGYGLPVPLIVKLFDEVEAFRSLKIEVVPAGPKYTQVLEATDGRLHVAGGWAVMQFIEALDRGVHAFMPTALHRIYTTMYTLYQQGHRDQAQALFQKLLPVLTFSNQHLDISIHFFKRLLHAQGTFKTPRVRQPILPFDQHHQKSAEEHVRLVKSLDIQITHQR